MALLRSKGPVAEPVPAIPIGVDPLYGYPEAGRLVALLQSGDWGSVDAELAAVSDLDHREALAGILAKTEASPSAFDEWAAKRPVQGLLIRGMRRTAQAWDVRTAKRAEHVEPSTWEQFFSMLRAAESDLLRAVDLVSGNDLAWSALITTGKGLQIPKPEAWARYRRATSGQRQRLVTAERMLQYLCGKWHGSHDEMFDFAVSTSRSAPDGHPIHRVVPMAVIERRLACKTTGEWNTEYNRPFYSRMLREAAYRSIDIEGFGPRPGLDPFHLGARNMFAAAYASINDQVLLRIQLEAIGMNMTTSPWDSLGGEREFLRLRAMTTLD
jgi:hypothetical protein